jgi:hypothetical protein
MLAHASVDALRASVHICARGFVRLCVCVCAQVPLPLGLRWAAWLTNQPSRGAPTPSESISSRPRPPAAPQELCDRGSLRAAIRAGTFHKEGPSGQVHLQMMPTLEVGARRHVPVCRALGALFAPSARAASREGSTLCQSHPTPCNRPSATNCGKQLPLPPRQVLIEVATAMQFLHNSASLSERARSGRVGARAGVRTAKGRALLDNAAWLL